MRVDGSVGGESADTVSGREDGALQSWVPSVGAH